MPGTITDDAALEWVMAQIDAHDRGELLSCQIQELEALPGWTWDRDKAAKAHLLICSGEDGV
jgi:hypothetical protein